MKSKMKAQAAAAAKKTKAMEAKAAKAAAKVKKAAKKVKKAAKKAAKKAKKKAKKAAKKAKKKAKKAAKKAKAKAKAAVKAAKAKEAKAANKSGPHLHVSQPKMTKHVGAHSAIRAAQHARNSANKVIAAAKAGHESVATLKNNLRKVNSAVKQAATRVASAEAKNAAHSMDLVQMQDALFETTLHSRSYKNEEFQLLQNPRMIKWARKDLRKAAETAARANQAIAKPKKEAGAKPAAKSTGK